MNEALFKIGADAWWLDTTEPETEGRETNLLVAKPQSAAIGNGARYANEFPLLTTTAVYQGQREASDKKRVFILSRSAFAGAQRNAVTTWSGDVDPNWETFRRQIPAGLNYSLSGLPYWTTDIGGFVSANPDDPAYRELFVRWFEFGTFCPIFRVHAALAVFPPNQKRALVLRPRGPKNSGRLRQPALSLDALHLLSSVEDHERRLYHHASARQRRGLHQRRLARAKHRRPISFRPRDTCKSRH